LYILTRNIPTVKSSALSALWHIRTYNVVETEEEEEEEEEDGDGD
jgi:hypothetical protein